MIKLYAKVLIIIIAAAVCLFHLQESFAGELGTDFMIDLWKYRTGEADTGLLTGRPSHIEPEAPPKILATVTGTVDCLQALPLRPNDIVEVQLLDFTSRSSAAVIAYQKITSARHIPVPFRLSYDPAGINPVDHYTVQARILRNGEPSYCNTAPSFVLTHGYAENVRVLITATGKERAVRTDDSSSPAAFRLFIGTYERKFAGAGGTVQESLRILSDQSVELYTHYEKDVVKQSGVWSLEKNLLAVTITHKNAEPVSPERIVFELKGPELSAVEYNTAAHGRNYSFTRAAVQQ
jgi:putative lipoprotein